MELLQSWPCSHQIGVYDNDEPSSASSIEDAFTIVYPTTQSLPPIRRPVWDSSPRRHERQEREDDGHDNNDDDDDDDDYAWYYKHPERYIWRPRLIKSRRQKPKQFTMFDLLLCISRDSWINSDGNNTPGTRDSIRSDTWSLLSSSTKGSDVGLPKN